MIPNLLNTLLGLWLTYAAIFPVTVGAHNGALMWALSAATIVMGVYWAPVIAFANRSLQFITG